MLQIKIGRLCKVKPVHWRLATLSIQMMCIFKEAKVPEIVLETLVLWWSVAGKVQLHWLPIYLNLISA